MDNISRLWHSFPSGNPNVNVEQSPVPPERGGHTRPTHSNTMPSPSNIPQILSESPLRRPPTTNQQQQQQQSPLEQILPTFHSQAPPSNAPSMARASNLPSPSPIQPTTMTVPGMMGGGGGGGGGPPSGSMLPSWAEPQPTPTQKQSLPAVYSEAYVRHLQSIVDQARRHSTEIERAVTDLARQLEDKQRECDELRRALTVEVPVKSAMQKEHKERVRLEDEVAKLRNIIAELERDRDRVEQERDIFRERFTVLSRVPYQHSTRSEAVNTFFDKYLRNSENSGAASSWKITNTGSVRREELIRYLSMLDREHVILLSREGVFDFCRVLCHRMILRAAAKEKGNLCGTASELIVDKKSGVILAHEGLEPPPSLEGIIIPKPSMNEEPILQARARTPSPPLPCEKNLTRLYLQRMATIATDRMSAVDAHEAIEHLRAELERAQGDEGLCCELLHRFLAHVGLSKEPIRDFHLDSNPRVFLDFTIAGDRVGRIEIELYKHICPKTCKNFMAFCCGNHVHKDGSVMSYKGAKIHAIMLGFAIFGGSSDPDSSIFHRPFPSESYEILPDQPGRVMTENNEDPENNTSLFCITATEFPDEYKYRGVAFGQVVRGLDLVKSIAEQPVVPDTFNPEHDIVISNCGLVAA